MKIKCLPLGDLDTNCYLVWADNGEGIVIDPADSADLILEAIRQENITITAVVLSHVHFDHILAAEAVCKATGAPLCVGAGDVDALTDPNRSLLVWAPADFSMNLTCDKALQEGDTLTFGDETLTVWETPGHTPGCLCLLNDGVVFSGDTLFCGAYGRLDFPGGDMKKMISSLRRLATLPNETLVYSGHGPVTTIGAEVVRYPSLR